ncbi:hypothetical protein [Kingella potus]|uniref:hypothetical protein n=1 Tax=Kingella potus TaxID=265175 RepID=UPI001FD0B0FC|nr:hypothetical protein [Kingella potus]UOP01080.1 hypothetical protein LVJ84_01600 [Kingella potus]
MNLKQCAAVLAAAALMAANAAQAAPTVGEKKQAAMAAVKAAKRQACDAGFEKIMVQSESPQPVYLVLWYTESPSYDKDPDTGETRCSGGSGSSYFGLARVVQTGGSALPLPTQTCLTKCPRRTDLVRTKLLQTSPRH